jgi:thiamine transport system ATP-binding protein
LSTLAVEGLRVTYGDTVAVDGVDLHVASGEIVTLLGPSGCGKSTILRTVAGLITPDAGRISIDDADLAGVPPHLRRLGLMFQDYALFPHRDVAGNVAFGPRMQREDRGAIAEQVRTALALVGLAGYEHRSIVSLSGGEQQRVALARTLAPSPRLLMLDEPLGSLDRFLRERLTVELRDLFRSLGTTTITVTHDQGEAFTIADRVVVMRDGRIVQSGRPVDVWREPADGFVARFLGFANVFDVDVQNGTAHSPAGTFSTERGDGPACLVLRPDAVTIVPDGGRTGSGAAADVDADVKGTAAVPSFRGDHFLVPVETDGGATIEVVVRSALVPAPGDPIGVRIDPTAVLLIDRETSSSRFIRTPQNPKE